MPVIITLLFLGILLVFSAFFAGSETAIFSLSKMEKRRLKDQHPRLAPVVNQHLDHPRKTLVTILIGNLMVNTLATSLVTLFVMRTWGAHYLTPALILFTFFLIYFGEILPKTFAVRMNEKVSLFAALPLQFFAVVFLPIRWLVQIVSDFFSQFAAAPESKEHSENMSGDELKTLVKIGEEEGVLDRDERAMLHKTLELGERPVKEIMTPRIRLAALDIHESRKEQLEIIQKYHFTHFPVFQDTIDNLIGVVAVQEYILNPDKKLSEIMKEPLIVPELKRIDDLLSDFSAKGENFAVCVDEHGGTAGIVTLEDIYEEIFGEFYDEYAVVEHPIRPLARHEYIVEGKVTLADFNDYFATQLESEAVSTLAGYILEQMGEVPKRGQVLKTDECEIRIHAVIRRRLIKSVIVRLYK